jgi:uncharacterized protein YkwD
MVPFARRVLVRAAAVAVAALSCVSLAPAVASADDPQLDRQERWVLGAINQYRSQAGVQPVQSSSTLSAVAALEFPRFFGQSGAFVVSR